MMKWLQLDKLLTEEFGMDFSPVLYTEYGVNIVHWMGDGKMDLPDCGTELGKYEYTRYV